MVEKTKIDKYQKQEVISNEKEKTKTFYPKKTGIEELWIMTIDHDTGIIYTDGRSKEDILNKDGNVLSRNKTLIKDLCKTHHSYNFCVKAFEQIGRRESSHLKEPWHIQANNYWSVHKGGRKGETKRIGSELVRKYKTEEEGIKDFFYTILKGKRFWKCSNYWCIASKWYAEDPNWNPWGVRVKNLADLIK